MRRQPTLCLLAALCLAAGAAAAQPVVSYSKAGAKFADVRDDLKNAIESRGFVIDYQSQIGAMLERTGKDVGSAKKVYEDAQALQFCSAQLSRKMMEADPANVVMCPYTLVVYATAGQPDRVFVTYRRPLRQGQGVSPASQAALREVDALLDKIAREAVGRK
ncbi:MAG: DUF302 domain-containing protein [Rubrivivax sp.]|nr:DUF302 domain-containing protein [Rubrivivax sp.]